MSPAHTAPMGNTPRRMLITVCAMTATIMQALDTTIANVEIDTKHSRLPFANAQENKQGK
jgi:DHA2 family multidrug resistance protein